MPVPRGVTDPLSLGGNYECTRATDRDGVDFDDIYASNGTFLQEDAESRLYEINAEYYMRAAGTKVQSGSMHAGYVIDDCEVSAASKQHKTMSLKAHKHEAVKLTSTL